MWKKSQAFREEFSNDDASVSFSVDSNMYTELGIRKPKKGEENIHDMEKIYQYQLEKDLEKIVKRKGTYKSRAELFTKIRESDPEYRQIALPADLGARGDFAAVDQELKNHSWQSTSKPYGEIAHKRYLEYLANLPKGPTKDEIQDKQQRHMDRELWEKVVEGRLDPTKRDEKRKEQELLRKQRRLMGEDEDGEDTIVLDRDQLRRKAFLENEFAEMRYRPTEREFHRSMRDWHRGIHYPFTTDKGFPVLVRRKIHSVKNEEKNIVPDVKRPKSAPITSDRFIQGNYGQEKRFAEFLAQQNFDKAEEYLQNDRKREEKKKLREERRKREATLRRRRGGHQGVEIALMVNDAKWAQMEEKHVMNIQAEKVRGDDNFILGDDGVGGEGGVVLRQGIDAGSAASSSSSSSSSSSGSGSGDKKDSYEKADDDDEEDDEDDEDEDEDEDDDGDAEEEKVDEEGEAKRDDDGDGNDAEAPETKKRRGKGKKGAGKKPKHLLSPEERARVERERRRQQRAREQLYQRRRTCLSYFLGDSSVDWQYLRESLYDHVYFSGKRVYDTVFPPSRAQQYRQELNLTHTRRKDRFDIGIDKEMITQRRTCLSTLLQGPGYLAARLRRRIEEAYEDSLLQKAAHSAYRRFHYYVLDASEIQSATSRFKQEALKKLRRVKQDLHEHQFKEQLLQLREDELSTDAMIKFLKRKRQELTTEIHDVEDEMKDAKDNNAPVGHYVERLAKLRTRLQYCDLLEQDRLQREQSVQVMLTVAEEMLRRKESDVEALTESWLERRWYAFLNRVQEMKKSGLAMLESVDKHKANTTIRLLPPPSKDRNNYATEVKKLLQRRIRERQRDAWMNRRLGWVVGKEPKLEDQEFTLDDLMVACVAGNYREVLDILDPRMTWDEAVDPADLDEAKPTTATSKINAVNFDTMTPLYATLMVVLKRQIVDEAVDLASWQLSPLQRFQRRVRNVILQKGDWNQPRFDLVIMVLLYYGADLNFARAEYNTDGETILHVACKMGATDVVEWMLQQGVDCNQLTSRDYRLPLMLAVERNHLSVAMILLRYGAVIAVNHQDRLGNTVMHEAARYASLLLTKVLLISGAMTHKRNVEGKLPTEIAQSMNRIEVMTTMQSYRDGSIEHLVRLEFLRQMTPESMTMFLHAMGDDFGAIDESTDQQQQQQSLSIDTSWDTVQGAHQHQHHAHHHREPKLMTTSEKRVMKIWKPYLKGAKINPLKAGDNFINPADIRAAQRGIPEGEHEDSDLDHIDGAIPVFSDSSKQAGGMSSTKTANTSDYVASAPRVRRTMLQLSFAKK